MKIVVYFKFKLRGEHEYLGATADFGEFAPEKEVDYTKLAAMVNVEKLVEMMGFSELAEPGTAEVITPEEYKRDFDDEAGEGGQDG